MRSFNSRYAFYALLVGVRARTVCDVGSCDGEQAIRFKKLRRRARVVAFEANPINFGRISQTPAVQRLGIELVPKAAADASGQVTFFLLEQRPDKQWAKGSSSLNRRLPEMNPGLAEVPTPVDAVRLDEFLAGAEAPIALWIDVEGAAGRVVEGLRGVADRVALIHVELESEALWVGQETSASIVEKLAEMGFTEIGRSHEWRRQENVLFGRADAGRGQRVMIQVGLVVAAVYGAGRRALPTTGRRAPACSRRR